MYTRRKRKKAQPTQSNYNYIPDENTFNDSLNSHNTTPISSRDDSFNNRFFIRESHNCYTYFLNLKSKEAFDLCRIDFKNYNMCRRAQPGYLSGYSKMQKKDFSCPVIEERTLKDNPNIYKLNSIKDSCKPEFYKGAMVVAPNRDYHYYRLNDEGIWSHKPGYKHSTIYDSENNIIIDPKLAARDYGSTLNYKDFCGYYCVPRNSSYKNMTHKKDKYGQNKDLIDIRNNLKESNAAYKEQKDLLKQLKIGKTNNYFNSISKRTARLLENKKLMNNQRKTRKKTQQKTRKKR